MTNQNTPYLFLQLDIRVKATEVHLSLERQLQHLHISLKKCVVDRLKNNTAGRKRSSDAVNNFTQTHRSLRPNFLRRARYLTFTDLEHI